MELPRTDITIKTTTSSARESKTSEIPVISGISEKSEVKNIDSTISESAVTQAVNSANDFLKENNRSIEFSIDKDSGKTVVELRDKDTNAILRQYPSKQMLEIAKDLSSLRGSLVSEKS